MTAAKGMDVISRLLCFGGVGSDAVSPYTQVKMEDAPDVPTTFLMSKIAR